MLTGPDITPAVHQTAYGLTKETTRTVHTVDGAGWILSFVPGNPKSLWAEHRDLQVILYAMSVCGRALHTQQGDALSENQKACRSCTDPAYRSAQATRF